MIKDFEIVKSWVDLEDGNETICHTNIKIKEEKYRKIGISIDGEENYSNDGWLSMLTIEGDKVTGCELYYLSSDGPKSIMLLEKGKYGANLRKAIIEDVIVSCF